MQSGEWKEKWVRKKKTENGLGSRPGLLLLLLMMTMMGVKCQPSSEIVWMIEKFTSSLQKTKRRRDRDRDRETEVSGFLQLTDRVPTRNRSESDWLATTHVSCRWGIQELGNIQWKGLAVASCRWGIQELGNIQWKGLAVASCRWGIQALGNIQWKGLAVASCRWGYKSLEISKQRDWLLHGTFVATEWKREIGWGP